MPWARQRRRPSSSNGSSARNNRCRNTAHNQAEGVALRFRPIDRLIGKFVNAAWDAGSRGSGGSHTTQQGGRPVVPDVGFDNITSVSGSLWRGLAALPRAGGLDS